jgi:hypothetical protein
MAMETHLVFSLVPLAWQRGFMLVVCSVAGLRPASTQAADAWSDISSPLLEHLTNSGPKLAWPGGCSGVITD